jgi:hypothetical protein
MIPALRSIGATLADMACVRASLALVELREEIERRGQQLVLGSSRTTSRRSGGRHHEPHAGVGAREGNPAARALRAGFSPRRRAVPNVRYRTDTCGSTP